jgi:hypothetical protein
MAEPPEPPDNQRPIIDFRSAQTGNVRTGDVVGRDKIDHHYYAPQLSPEQARQRRLLLAKVERRFASALVDKLLDAHQRLDLAMTAQPRQVVPEPNRRLERPNMAARPLSAGTPISAVFEECGQALLILGAPGAGKSTLLLELGRDLVAEASTDVTFPIPVLLNLASWAQRRQKLDAWLAEEVSRSYGVGNTLAQHWVAEDALLPLLDGLDEVAAEHRGACIAAINTFRQAHGTLPLAVCSRSVEYGRLRERLMLESAVMVEDLTPAQIEAYLRAGGDRLTGLAQALGAVSVLRELLTTPLMLSVADQAFADRSAASLQFNTTAEAERHLWGAYVRRMRSRAGAAERFNMHHLVWLAAQMHTRSASEFYIERLQPDWLPRTLRWRYRLLSGLAAGLLTGLASTLALELAFRLTGVLAGGLVGVLAGVLVVGLGAGLVIGLAVTLFNISLFSPMTIKTIGVSRWSWMRGLVGGLALGLAGGLVFGLAGGLVFGLVGGLALGLAGGVAVGLAGVLALGLAGALAIGWETDQVKPDDIQRPNEGMWRTAGHTGRSALLGLLAAGVLASLNILLQDTVRRFQLIMPRGLTVLLLLSPLFVWLLATINGGDALMQHGALRLALRWSDLAPWDYAAFLTRASDQLLMRRVGGGFSFWHLQLRDYLATLTPEEFDALQAD